MAKTKVRTLEVVEGELRGAQDLEARLVREMRQIPDALAEAEREERIEDLLQLRRRGEELPVHIWSASRTRLRLAVEAQSYAVERIGTEIGRLAEETSAETAKALEAQERANVLSGQWYKARDDRHDMQRRLSDEKKRLASLEAGGPNYDLLKDLTNQARGVEEPRVLKRL